MLVLLSLVLVLVLSAALGYWVRRRVMQARLLRGPGKILLTLADVTFINLSLSNKVRVLHLGSLERSVCGYIECSVWFY